MSGLTRRRLVSVAGAAAGIGLFAVMLDRVGAAGLVSAMRRVGDAFAVVILLAGLRLALRAWAWTVCAGGAARLPFLTALNACIVGEGAGNVTPLGLAASEPAKVLWVRHRLGTIDAASALATETLIYSVGVAVMLAAGAAAWVAVAAPPTVAVTVAAGAGAALAAGAIVWLAGWRPGAAAAAWLDARAAREPRLSAFADGVRRTRQRLRELASHDRRRLLLVAAMQAAFQVLAVAEVWVTLACLGDGHVTFAQAFLLEFANRAVTVAFKFVPMRLGVDELAGSMMASVVGMGGTAGITSALVRKARVACWTAVGIGLAAVRMVRVPSPVPALHMAEEATRRCS